MQILMLDGAMGTELARRGWDVSDSLWSARVLLEHPEAIEQIHYDYLHAGADCITTASYQVSFAGFEQARKSREATVLALTESVRLAKQARARFANSLGRRREPLVAASVGPYGASLADGSEYHGNYGCGPDELLRFHLQRMFCLSAAEPDLFACETIPSWEEAEILLQAVHQFPHLSAWFSFACKDGQRTVHGELIRDCARALSAERQVVADRSELHRARTRKNIDRRTSCGNEQSNCGVSKFGEDLGCACAELDWRSFGADLGRVRGRVG